MDLGIRDKVALVMGASSGLGKAIAATLAHEGVKIAICARQSDRLQTAAKELSASLTIAKDLTLPNAGREAVAEVLRKMQRLDILVVNTGGPPKGQFSEITAAMWQESFQSLWMSAIESIQEALPTMKSNKFGRIILVTSVAAKEPLAALTISNGLRAGLLGLARSLSHEVAADGITINSLLPGYTSTDRLTSLGVDLQKMAEQIPAKRIGTPEDFAAAAAFLASRQAGYITGQTIAVDGGSLRGI